MCHEKLQFSLFKPIHDFSELSEEYESIGRYGQLYQEHLEKIDKKLYQFYTLTGQLWSLAAEIEMQAVTMKKTLVQEMLEEMDWNGRSDEDDMDAINDAAERIVLTELVYA